MKLSTLVISLIIHLCAQSYAGQLSIVANPGEFGSIQKAAESEASVNWWDDDYSDDRACTESFAAVELVKFLKECTAYDPNQIVLRSAGKLPETGDVILLGSEYSNPLIKLCSKDSGDKLKTAESFSIRGYKQNKRLVTVIEGKDRVGTLYAVYYYLEQLGYQFYGLGDRSNQRAGTVVSVPYMLPERVKQATGEIKKLEEYVVPSKGTVYPSKRVELPGKIDIVENPCFTTRGFWTWQPRGDEDFFLWMARNRMNLWTAAEENVHYLKKLGMKLIDGGHAVQSMFLNPEGEYPYNHKLFEGDEGKASDPYQISKDFRKDENSDGRLSYYEAHPEWYGLRGGKRSPNIRSDFGDNYCTSNADATRELAQNLVNNLIDGQFGHVDMLNVWMLDNGKWCECEKCKEQGTYTDRLFVVCDAVLKEMADARRNNRLQRDVEISTCAYHETLPPPSRKLPEDFDYQRFSVTFYPIERCYAHSLDDAKCTEVNMYIVDIYKKWTIEPNRLYKGTMFIGEYYNVSAFKTLPALFTGSMAEDIPFYFETGSRHLNYMHVPTRLWGTWTLNNYLLAKLLWNSKTNVSRLLDEYFENYYPTTAKETRSFYTCLEKATLNIKPYKHYVGFGGTLPKPGVHYSLPKRLESENSELFPTEHLKYEIHKPNANDAPDVVEIIDYMRRARRHIDAALLTCKNETEMERLLEDERRFAYGEAVFSLTHHLTRTAIADRSGQTELATREFQHAQELMRQLCQITDVVHVSSSHTNETDGFEAAQVKKSFELFKEKYDQESK